MPVLARWPVTSVECLMAQLELWGGPECTVNRVGDGYRDQSVLSGHHDRLNDLDLFAGLGLKAIRSHNTG
jgi:dTDP-4-dehydrorhamnose reductase